MRKVNSPCSAARFAPSLLFSQAAFDISRAFLTPIPLCWLSPWNYKLVATPTLASTKERVRRLQIINPVQRNEPNLILLELNKGVWSNQKHGELGLLHRDVSIKSYLEMPILMHWYHKISFSSIQSNKKPPEKEIMVTVVSLCNGKNQYHSVFHCPKN